MDRRKRGYIIKGAARGDGEHDLKSCGNGSVIPGRKRLHHVPGTLAIL